MEDDVREDLRRLGKTIRSARERLNLSQEEFAEHCLVHRTYIGQVERGEKNLSWESISRIARALDVKPSALLHRAGL